MGKNVIFLGADFSANAISESVNLVNINLTDGHSSPIWRSQDEGQTYSLYNSGYGGWAATNAYSVGSYNKLKGTLSFYTDGNLILPPVVFLDSENQFVSAYVPSNPSVVSGYRYADIDIDIPLGASKVLLQVFTGDTRQSIFFTSAYAYMYK